MLKKGLRVCYEWVTTGNDWYYFDADGKMVRDHFGVLDYLDDKNLYLFASDGKVARNCEREVNGREYVFDDKGRGKELPYYTAKSVIGRGYNFFIKDFLPKKIMYYDGEYIIENNIEFNVDGQILYVKGIVECQKSRGIRERLLTCRLSMIDEDEITLSRTKTELIDAISVGQRTYFYFEMRGLPINGGDIYVEFYAG